MDLQTRQLLDQLFDELDRTDYYTMLGVSREADQDEIRRAFYQRADLMHPDRHYNIVDSDLREKLYVVYKRVAEAYRVLGTFETRREYDGQLQRGKVRYQADTLKDVPGRSAEMSIKNLRARKLFKDARTALDAGNVQGALLALKMADSMEPGSVVIQTALMEVTETTGAKK